jgi:hypothetical protein
VQGEVDRARQAMTSPRAAGEYAGSMVDPLRLASALRRGPMLELDVYHGTPHRFEPTEANPLGELDASKIGSGEGAQAYGHGIYLAESPGVAREYKRVLSDQLASSIHRNQFGVAQAKKYAEKWQAMLDDPSIPRPLRAKDRSPVDDNWLKKQIADEAQEQERLNKWLETKQPGGALYTLDLPDEMIDRMLDWDKPLSEQSAAVKKALGVVERDFDAENALIEKAKALGVPVNSLPEYERLEKLMDEAAKFRNETGASFYRGGDPAKRAAELRALGIPGVRYLDAGSRGKDGTGTRNFVVFPGEEKKVKILRRE